MNSSDGVKDYEEFCEKKKEYYGKKIHEILQNDLEIDRCEIELVEGNDKSLEKQLELTRNQLKLLRKKVNFIFDIQNYYEK